MTISSKNIIICCDGTNNQLDGDLTNVVRLFQVAVKNQGQAAFYDPGVGTMASPYETTRLGKRWSLVKGLAFGTGLDDNVFKAYRYLMQNYEEGDKVYLFGFSRGAFTIRVLAGMLHGVGLLHAGAENLLPYIWNTYRAIRIMPKNADDGAMKAAQAYAARVNVLRGSFTRPCPIAFLGPWDTVGSVGMYNWNQAYPHTFENSSVAIVRHAVALDERRAGFRSNVFKGDDTPLANNRPRVMNVWFAGVHSDIGGGYPFADSGLAMITFQWMLREAKEAGMLVDDAEVRSLLSACAPDPAAKRHESLAGGWKAMEYVPARRFDWTTAKTAWRYDPGKPRATRVAPVILHRSVIDKIKIPAPAYWPACLPAMPVGDLEKQYRIEE